MCRSSHDRVINPCDSAISPWCKSWQVFLPQRGRSVMKGAAWLFLVLTRQQSRVTDGVWSVCVSVCFSVFLCVLVCVYVCVCVSGWPGLELTGCVRSETQQRECCWSGGRCLGVCLSVSLSVWFTETSGRQSWFLFWGKKNSSGFLVSVWSTQTSADNFCFNSFIHSRCFSPFYDCWSPLLCEEGFFACHGLTVCSLLSVLLCEIYSLWCVVCTSHTWLHISLYVEFWVSTPHLVSTSVT